MSIRAIGNWAVTGSLLVGAYYAYRDYKRLGWRRAAFEGSTTSPGSIEDTLAKGAAIGVAVFLLTRLAPVS